ncbi:MAG: presenilin family intramembrane aspartyl protease [Nanoarchaeota archaeon]|nr:presenilin family intramembrane aspartyl protease [Nanoarchaeota archaeon]
MKHNTKVTVILMSMFIITQLVGLFVISVYENPGKELPYGMEPPKELKQETSFISIIISFIIAIFLFLLLIRFRADTFIRLWFFLVTVLAIGLSVTAIFFIFKLNYAQFIALIFAFPLAYMKIFKRDMYIHNITELLIYPGIAAVLVSMLNVLGIILFLLLISLYDIWAVWYSEFMQKMARYQINNLKFFTGFFIPYTDRKQRIKIKEIRDKFKKKGDKVLEKEFKKARIKVHLAILGGGDVVFPIIAAGVFYKTYGSIIPPLIIALFSTFALLYLFIFAKKGKFYPAMPYITIGIYLAMILSWILMSFNLI